MWWESSTVDNLAEELGLIKVSSDDKYSHTVFWSLKELPKFSEWAVCLYKDKGDLNACTDIVIDNSVGGSFYTLSTVDAKPCDDVDTFKSYIKTLHNRYNKKFVELKKRKEMLNLEQIKRDFV